MTPVTRLVRRRTVAALATSAAIMFAGCRDSRALVPPSGRESPRAIEPQVIVSADGGGYVVTLAVELRGDVGKIGSFTGRLLYDPARLAFDGEVPRTDGTLRAFNPGSGVIRVAAASQSGLDLLHLAAFRFKAADPAALQTVRLELEEVHEVSRANLTSLVDRATTVRVLR